MPEIFMFLRCLMYKCIIHIKIIDEYHFSMKCILFHPSFQDDLKLKNSCLTNFQKKINIYS